MYELFVLVIKARMVLMTPSYRETKHITIWFQNKRQNERKVALQGATNNRTQVHPAQPQPQPPHRHLHYNNTLASPYTPIPGPDSPHLGPRAPVAPRARTRSHTTANQYPLARARTHPSLDHIASRSELRSPPSPNSPVRTRARTNSAPHAPENLWDSMPSSPLAPHADPVRECEREYVEFGRQIRGTSGRGRKTLEWACASARVSSSSASERKENCRKRKEMDVDAELNLDDLGVESDVTDDAEVHEALTPSNSFGHSVGTGVMGRNSKGTEVNDVRVKGRIQDEDMMAAYVLCGLGHGFR